MDIWEGTNVWEGESKQGCNAQKVIRGAGEGLRFKMVCLEYQTRSSFLWRVTTSAIYSPYFAFFPFSLLLLEPRNVLLLLPLQQFYCYHCFFVFFSAVVFFVNVTMIVIIVVIDAAIVNVNMILPISFVFHFIIILIFKRVEKRVIQDDC